MKPNTPLEVMEAIVKNGGPIEAWVSDEDDKLWTHSRVSGVILTHTEPYIIDRFMATTGAWFHRCSLTNPNIKSSKVDTLASLLNVPADLLYEAIKTVAEEK